MDLLADVSTRKGDFAFVPATLARASAAAVARAIALFVRAQVVIAGKRTIWGQQHDALTIAPVGARNFEPAALATDKSVGLIRLLRDHAPEATRSVEAAASWLRDHALHDVSWHTVNEGRILVAKPGSGPLWARFYDLEQQRPVFGDRDRTIQDDVNGLSRERRNGYSWFTQRPCAKSLGNC